MFILIISVIISWTMNRLLLEFIPDGCLGMVDGKPQDQSKLTLPQVYVLTDCKVLPGRLRQQLCAAIPSDFPRTFLNIGPLWAKRR